MISFKRHIRTRWAWPGGILWLALALRLIWLRDAGYPYDVPFFVRWMRLAAQNGTSQVFSIASSSYPPLSVYLLGLLGRVSPDVAPDAPPVMVELLALRVTTVFFDLLMIAVLYALGRRVAGRQAATWAALLYALCPGDIYLSGWWVQIDAWFVLPMVLGAWWLSQKRVGLAWIALGLAMMLKLQAILVLPIFAVGTWRWWGMRRLLNGGLVLAVTLGLVAAPILVSGQASDAISRMTQPIRSLQWISLESHNLWYVLTPHARSVGYDANRDQNVFAGGVSFHDAGLALLALGYSLILARLFMRSGPRAIFAACAVAWFTFFMLPARTHTRYIFPALAFMLCAGLYRRRWWALYGVAAVTLLVNLVLKSPPTSPVASALSIPKTWGIVNAWGNMIVWGLALIFYVTPLLKSEQHREGDQGALCVMQRNWETALLGVAVIILLGTLGSMLERGRAVGLQVAQLELSLRASLDESIRGAVAPGQNSMPAGEQVVVINWPHVIQDLSASVGGIIPVTPPALFLDMPDSLDRDVIWLQYPPWQQATGLEIEYHGAFVTQAELAERVEQAARTVLYNPHVQEMVVLAQYYPVTVPYACPVSFGDQVCLVDARATAQANSLHTELTWQVSGELSADVTVFIHVVDARGNLVAQSDGDPAGGLAPLALWESADMALYETRAIDVPAGDYDLRIGLYNRVNGERLAARCVSMRVCGRDALEIQVTNHKP